ncbi:MAG: forkhead-associated protein, partial [Chloroflexales bacterium]|nr:forkhead-associated protein [Chloroflexales bacterium]
IIVDSYIRSYGQSANVTLAAFDLAQIAPMSAQLDRLAGALLQGTPADYALVAHTRSLVRKYAPEHVEAYHAVDLGHLTQLLGAQGTTGEIAAAAEALGSAIQQARLAYGASQGYHDTSGISIYFPPTAAQYLPSYERDSPLPRQTSWAAFLKAYHHSLGHTR